MDIYEPPSHVSSPQVITQSAGSWRAAERGSAHSSPYPFRAVTSAPLPTGLSSPAPLNAAQIAVVHSLDAIPSAFVVPYVVDDLYELSEGESIIIPLLCAIARMLASSCPSAPPPNVVALEASVVLLSAHLVPSAPAPPPCSFARVVTVAALPPSQPQTPAQGKKKGKKKRNSDSSAEVAKASAEITHAKGPSASPTAARRFFASRTDALPQASAQQVIQVFPDTAANALREA
ncbi:hypothetical protein C7212DRAFT_347545 [Tuber magnatum]|uniref:Uncharacterized protein n=1 Tax=Tuber magnatum TaxID=42249 RepID=A0A317SIY2_9PEZI|nr:hypothetical protein C7212DRAFT_347545 [Tuber magnatum]